MGVEPTGSVVVNASAPVPNEDVSVQPKVVSVKRRAPEASELEGLVKKVMFDIDSAAEPSASFGKFCLKR